MRLIFITDFTEQFAYRLLRGIINYSRETEPWVVCKMPPSVKKQKGLDGLLDFAIKWKADVIIGQFLPTEDVSVFRKYGIVAIAQDYIKKFDCIPNITADYEGTGAMAAKRFISRGFQNFGFFGYRNVCWSDDRCKGFHDQLVEAGFGDHFYKYDRQVIDSLWTYDQKGIEKWLTSIPKPAGIMACDDTQGAVLLQFCNAMGIKVPSQVAVIGVDNDEVMCSLTVPALSSVNVDIERGGYETAAMAERMVKDPSYEGEDIVLRPINLVARMSSNVFATKDTAILQALQFISANVDHKITVPDVLKEVPLSRRLLEQRFLKETGTTIYKYISALRMDRFAQLLLASNDPIADIAARMEEPDTKSISRRFQMVKGCTPTEYRKQKLRKLGR
jgi:LacI family transcriptional regulator